MRVISGSLKGRSINFIKNSNTRPLKDNVRESIFNVLKHSSVIKTKIENSNILDLYSGIGSFGIESISRGAKKVTFIDKNTEAINVLRGNLNQLSILNKSKIHDDKIENILTKQVKEKYNIFFLDPPFSDYEFLNNLKLIKKRKIFDRNHIVVIHREKKSEDEFKDLLEVIEIKQYGRSKIIFGLIK